MTDASAPDSEVAMAPEDANPSLLRTLFAKADPELSDDALQALELRHRTKNILSIVQSLVNQTLRGEVTVEDARQALTDRLVAMGNAVDLLIQNDWKAAELEDIIASALTHRGRFGERVTLAGPPMHIGSGAAMSLNLALQELESNAIKYGALSAEDGTVRIEWSVGATDPANWLRLEWQEAGGPVVVPPNRKGFGTKLLATAIGRRLGGSTELDYRPEGFRWVLHASADGLRS